MIKTEEAVKMTTGDVMKGKIKGIPGQIKDGFTSGKDKLFKAKEKLEGLKNWEKHWMQYRIRLVEPTET